jgi:hypothetical protein
VWRKREWVVAAVAALLGWLFALLLAAAGVVHGVWALGAGLVFALALATVYGRSKRVTGLAFVCVTLEWPVLFLVTLLLAYLIAPPSET